MAKMTKKIPPAPFKNVEMSVSTLAKICNSTKRKLTDAFGEAPYYSHDLIRQGYGTLSDRYDDDSSVNPIRIEDPSERLSYLRGELVIEDILAKQRKNRKDSGELLDANTTERALADTFKSLSTFLETLPDQLERKGLIQTEDIQAVIDMVDNIRRSMAEDMKKVSG